MASSWTSKTDMIRDLYQVTGRTGAVAEDFIIRGQKPPPPRRIESDDEELELRYGIQPNSDYMHDNKGHTPDLQGIMDMLRIVNEEEAQQDSTAESESIPLEKIVISKLDPNVQEFVPRGNVPSQCSDKENILPNNNEKAAVTDDEGEKNKAIEISKKIDVSKLKPNEINDISKQLRNKINVESSKDNLHSKRERNVAIATLLKIHSAAPSSAEPSKPAGDIVKPVNKTIKLLSPQYFEKSPSETISKEKEVNGSKRNGYCVIPEEIENQVNTSSDLVKDENLAATSSSSSSVRSPVESRNYQNEQVRESINKVNQWFQGPKSPKPSGPVVCLGPIEFKQKSISPMSSEVVSKASTPTKTVVSDYKPSQYAENLSKIFVERSMKREIEQNNNIWALVQQQLLEKKKKLREKASSSQSQGDSSRNISSDDANSTQVEEENDAEESVGANSTSDAQE